MGEVVEDSTGASGMRHFVFANFVGRGEAGEDARQGVCKGLGMAGVRRGDAFGLGQGAAYCGVELGDAQQAGRFHRHEGRR